MGNIPQRAQDSAPETSVRAGRPRGRPRRPWAVRGILTLALLLASSATTRDANAQVSITPTPGSPDFFMGIGDIVLDPVNLAKNIEHFVKRIQQMDMQRRQLQAQIDAIRKLPNPNWRNLGQLAQQLDQVVQQANGIAYTLNDAGRVFAETFPGYTRDAQRLTPAFARAHAQRTLATLRGIVGAASAHGRDMQGSMATLSALKSRMSTTQGPQQAAELQTTVAGFQADQLAMLRQTMVMQTTAAAVVAAERIQQQATSDMVLEQAARRMSAYRPLEGGGFDGTKRKRRVRQ
jgi:P-type conjugative transfer protein TrbJ